MKRGVGREVWDRLLLRLFIPVGLLLLLSPRHSKDVSVEGGREGEAEQECAEEEGGEIPLGILGTRPLYLERKKEGGGEEGRKLPLLLCLSAMRVLSEAKKEGKGGLSVLWRWRKGRKEGGDSSSPYSYMEAAFHSCTLSPPPCVCKLVTGVSPPPSPPPPSVSASGARKEIGGEGGDGG